MNALPDFCVLAAPLGACGSLAVGERRETWDRPGRSAVLGLVAGCLGIEREDEDAHQALETGYGVALRVERLGPLLADYHTAQMPRSVAGGSSAPGVRSWRRDNLGTILSRRDYHTDIVVFVALWPRNDDAPWSLEAIAQAMRAPQFVPYLGRRACPLMLPLSPEVVEAVDPVAALVARAEQDRGLRLLALRPATNPVVALDAAEARSFGLPIAMSRCGVMRSANRQRWQFNLREEAVL